jgi:anti-sigma regulatory factor (Ser/Thr protein kinase)
VVADPASQPEIRLELVSEPELLSAVRALIGRIAQRIGFSDKECGQIALALDEALCNVINHGYARRPDGRIWVSIWRIPDEPRGINIVLEDQGKQVDPASIKSRDLDEIRPGGLGVHIIQQTMDHVRYEKRDGGGMRLTMMKRVASNSHPDS